MRMYQPAPGLRRLDARQHVAIALICTNKNEIWAAPAALALAGGQGTLSWRPTAPQHLSDVADAPQRRLAPYMRIRSSENKIQMRIYILLTCAATLHEQSTFTHRQSQHTTVTHATARSFTARHTHQFIDAIISAILHEHLHMSVGATTNEHNTFAHSPN